eukprot:CAMPEP_0113458204 /NCGR_PEP_ID=MMETSP0014_2-20120614/9802_1 /TAXON_ID=2857 /ORGANISM="Nitzschia sp." /LENGTH=95 /DNA_ID=CAMNT_0000349721 /DNA_START=2382 /DNA_END=2670 /DNA_ORIENTATION=- /assembly_acc=CAM_ASM_000159
MTSVVSLDSDRIALKVDRQVPTVTSWHFKTQNKTSFVFLDRHVVTVRNDRSVSILNGDGDAIDDDEDEDDDDDGVGEDDLDVGIVGSTDDILAGV